MNYYLVIGHACDEEQEWQFSYSDKELSDAFLEEKFTKNTLEELGYEPDEYERCGKEVYIDFIFKSILSCLLSCISILFCFSHSSISDSLITILYQS